MYETYRASGRETCACCGRPSGDTAKAAIAHDLGNALQIATSALRGACRRLDDRSEDDVATTLGDALAALDRAGLLTHELTAAGAPKAALSLVRIQTLVPSLRRLLKHTLGDAIRLETLVREDLPPVPCDRHQLENVLFNLVINARDAMPAGGLLTIEADRCAPGVHGANCVTLSVADTGHGMSDEVAGLAFDPFFTTKHARGGSGLGLHNVLVFANSLGGKAEISSSPANGACVRLHLPVAPPV